MNSLQTKSREKLIIKAYQQYREMLLGYIAKRVDDHDEAEDLTQEVFMRLLDSNMMIGELTLRSFIFTIAQNILIDYYRRKAIKTEVHSYMYDLQVQEVCNVEENVYLKNIEETEKKRMAKLPPQRRKIYYMSRFGELTIDEIAEQLSLSRRTIETHLMLGRKDIRSYLRHVICG